MHPANARKPNNRRGSHTLVEVRPVRTRRRNMKGIRMATKESIGPRATEAIRAAHIKGTDTINKGRRKLQYGQKSIHRRPTPTTWPAPIWVTSRASDKTGPPLELNIE